MDLRNMGLSPWLDVEFFETAWHRRPVLWRRAARSFLDPTGATDATDAADPTDAAGGDGRTGALRAGHDAATRTVDHAVVDGWVAAARAGQLPGTTLLRERLGVQFLEGVVAPPIERVVIEARALFATTEVWFDVVRTSGLGSIGSHFDDSDNFVVQLDGIKQWQLADADAVPEPQRSRRHAGDAAAASFPVTTPAWEAVARAGDVVYLPFGWPHHGIARTASLSISLVVKRPR
jgi:50S ribosomal protein L16 3-hydroxylase